MKGQWRKYAVMIFVGLMFVGGIAGGVSSCSTAGSGGDARTGASSRR